MTTVTESAPAPSAQQVQAQSSRDALAVVAACKQFGGREILRDVTFSVAAAEFVALLGPNGAGKTTLFQILTGLYAADSGSVTIGGHSLKRPSDWPAALGRLGVVFQQPALDLDLTVRANLEFHAALHGLTRASAKERIAALLARFGVADRATDPCRALSGGTRRKVELARALLCDPQLLLMDEATVGLDPASRAQLLEDVRAGCRSEQRAVLWATHLTEEAARADRVIVLHRGAILHDGTVADLLSKAVADTVEAAFLALTAAGPRPL